PFLEAIRQLHREVGHQNALYIHVTLVPYLNATAELKTKPTQQSVRELRSIGIQPDAIVCRSDLEVPDDIKEKIALFCDVEPRAVVPLPTVDTIYQVPLTLEAAGLGDYLVEKLSLPAAPPQWEDWRALVDRIRSSKDELRIAIVGKYVELPDSYLSIREALQHAAVQHGRDLKIDWVSSELIDPNDPSERLRTASGIVVAPGFGARGIEGKIAAARFARERGIPYLGLCLGMQMMTIEFARHVLGTNDVNSTEMDPETRHPVIDLMPAQRELEEKGGTMRLGAWPCQLEPDTIAGRAYGQPLIFERHRHRYEFNNGYRDVLTGAGLRISGTSPDGKLVEIVELEGHPFMLGCQFHPEYKSRPTRPHPLFAAFVAGAAKTLREGDQRALPLEPVAVT
ncbi:MAG TPA: CTP synthase, partial [Chloroflexota bacterium]|nr:CTP synthase [Chloroflexota bacterium]